MDPMPDEWAAMRREIGHIATLATALLPEAAEEAARLLLGVRPAKKARYRPYLAALDGAGVEVELALFPAQARAGGALLLLNLATEAVGLTANEWHVGFGTHSRHVLAGHSLALLEDLTRLLLEQRRWVTLVAWQVGSVLATAAAVLDARSSDQDVAGGLLGAQVRGLYAQGLAAFQTGDLVGAWAAWTVGTRQEAEGTGPVVAACRDGLAQIQATGSERPGGREARADAEMKTTGAWVGRRRCSNRPSRWRRLIPSPP
jgi:hypothetical protein